MIERIVLFKVFIFFKEAGQKYHVSISKMATLKVLQKSLEEAQKSLSVTDDTIRKVTGRDPNEQRLVVCNVLTWDRT